MKKRDLDWLAVRANRLERGTFLLPHRPPGKKNRPDTGAGSSSGQPRALETYYIVFLATFGSGLLLGLAKKVKFSVQLSLKVRAMKGARLDVLSRRAVGYVVGVFVPLFIGVGTDTPVWVVHEADGGKKAMIGYLKPTSSPDESI